MSYCIRCERGSTYKSVSEGETEINTISLRIAEFDMDLCKPCYVTALPEVAPLKREYDSCWWHYSAHLKGVRSSSTTVALGNCEQLAGDIANMAEVQAKIQAWVLDFLTSTGKDIRDKEE